MNMVHDDYSQLGDKIMEMQRMLSESYDNVMGTTKVKRIQKKSNVIYYTTIPIYISNMWAVSTFDSDCRTVRESAEFNCVACAKPLEANEFAYRVRYVLDIDKWKEKNRSGYYIPHEKRYSYVWFCYDCGDVWLSQEMTGIGEFEVLEWDRDTYNWGDPRKQQHNKILENIKCIMCDNDLIATSKRDTYSYTRRLNGSYVVINNISFIRHSNPLMCFCAENDPTKGKSK